jgi:hypothetical protein
VRKSYNLGMLAIALAFITAQAMGQVSKASDPDIQTSFAGSALICSQSPQTSPQTQTIRVPQPLAERAKLKARLVLLLRDSLYDDAGGIVNIAREKEIRKLANKLRSQRD